MEIAAPPARVWDLTVDVESWPDFTPTITKVERLDDGDLAVGSQARLEQPRQRPRIWTVTELEPGHSFAWSSKVLGLTMTARHLVEAAGEGARNTLSVDVDGALAPMLGRLLRGPIMSAITTENQGFKSAAEA